MVLSTRATEAKDSVATVTSFFASIQGADDPDALDFTFGNPHEPALHGLTEAMRAHLDPRSADWYAYKTSERSAQEAFDQRPGAYHAHNRNAD